MLFSWWRCMIRAYCRSSVSLQPQGAEPVTLCRLPWHSTKQHSEANLRQLGPGREFQRQHSDQGKALMSETQKLGTFYFGILWVRRVRTQHIATGLSTCEKFAHVHANGVYGSGLRARSCGYGIFLKWNVNVERTGWRLRVCGSQMEHVSRKTVQK